MQESLAEINAKSDGQFYSKVRYNLLQLFLIETDITVTGNPEPFPSPAYKVIVGFPIRLLFLILSSLRGSGTASEAHPFSYRPMFTVSPVKIVQRNENTIAPACLQTFAPALYR